jgi:hypothetical protein
LSWMQEQLKVMGQQEFIYHSWWKFP